MGNNTSFLCAPFALLPRVLEVIKAQKATATVPGFKDISAGRGTNIGMMEVNVHG